MKNTRADRAYRADWTFPRPAEEALEYGRSLACVVPEGPEEACRVSADMYGKVEFSLRVHAADLAGAASAGVGALMRSLLAAGLPQPDGATLSLRREDGNHE